MQDDELQQMKRDLDKLRQDFDALSNKTKSTEGQSIQYPLDDKSREILNNLYLSKVGLFQWTSPGGNLVESILIKQAGRSFVVPIMSSFIPFTANISADTITMGDNLATGLPGLALDDMRVIVNSTGTLPAGLDDTTSYYVVSASDYSSTIQLSFTSGGAPINITSSGSGEHYLQLFT